MNFGIPQFQGKVMVFPYRPGYLVQLRFRYSQDIFSPDAEPGHARDVSFVLEGLETPENLLNFHRKGPLGIH
jgi:hypothetical protein